MNNRSPSIWWWTFWRLGDLVRTQRNNRINCLLTYVTNIRIEILPVKKIYSQQKPPQSQCFICNHMLHKVTLPWPTSYAIRNEFPSALTLSDHLPPNANVHTFASMAGLSVMVIMCVRVFQPSCQKRPFNSDPLLSIGPFIAYNKMSNVLSVAMSAWTSFLIHRASPVDSTRGTTSIRWWHTTVLSHTGNQCYWWIVCGASLAVVMGMSLPERCKITLSVLASRGRHNSREDVYMVAAATENECIIESKTNKSTNEFGGQATYSFQHVRLWPNLNY